MRVELTNTQIKILQAIQVLTLKRIEDKDFYINPLSIAKVSGLTWKTVKNHMLKGFV